MSKNTLDEKSTSIQVMFWCLQATNHYLSQCWPRSMPPYDVDNELKEIHWSTNRPSDNWTTASCHIGVINAQTKYERMWWDLRSTDIYIYICFTTTGIFSYGIITWYMSNNEAVLFFVFSFFLFSTHDHIIHNIPYSRWINYIVNTFWYFTLFPKPYHKHRFMRNCHSSSSKEGAVKTGINGHLNIHYIKTIRDVSWCWTEACCHRYGYSSWGCLQGRHDQIDTRLIRSHMLQYIKRQKKV